MVSPGSGGKRELKRNKDGGERIKLLPQTAWSDYFFFQNMQAYIWFVGLPAVPSGVRFQKTAGVVDADVLCRAEVVYGMADARNLDTEAGCLNEKTSLYAEAMYVWQRALGEAFRKNV